MRTWRPRLFSSHIPRLSSSRIACRMPKVKNPNAFYAVARGRTPGIYHSWDDCEQQVTGYNGSKHKKFTNLTEARDWFEMQSGLKAPEVASPAPWPAPTPGSSKRHAPYTKSKPGSASNGKSKSQKTGVEIIGPEESDMIVVYSDGACKGNGKPGSVAGVGIWWGDGDDR